MGRTKRDVYAEITEKVLACLAEGTVPWQKPWATTTGMPRNLKSGKAYRGINVFLLGYEPYTSPYWVTFKQAKALKGTVKRGEKGAGVVFWKFLKKKNSEGEEYSFPLLRYYTVFNTEQCEGLQHKRLTEMEAAKGVEPEPFHAIMAAEELVAGYASGYPVGPNVAERGARAFYSPPLDHVTMPPRDTFESPEAFYNVLFHELTHSTGHESRLKREGVTNPTWFGSHEYSKEELVAEMGAAFLSGHAGISTEGLINNSAAYLHTWASKLKDEPKLIVNAAACAQKAVDHVLGTTFEDTTTDEE
jgi:antirestriction protein ArdC